MNRHDRSAADTHMIDEGDEDGPGLGSKRKSPSGMSIQKHSVALKLKDQTISPKSSLATSKNVSGEQVPA